MSNDDVVIHAVGLWKRYGLPLPEVYYRGRRWLRSLRNGRGRPSAVSNQLSSIHSAQSAIHNPQSDDGPWALRDLNLEVRHGETLGIIGRNGAGKSTLLKVLAGVTPPTRGKVDVRGRIFPMIELNAGIHSELTGRENVYLLGAVMGLTQREMEARIPEIEEFCELEEWLDRPVWKYSSGMLARLGFGVALNVEADVLLVDEVLAVGDLPFQRKCFDRLDAVRNSGVTFLLVTHNIRQVERLCDRAVLLDQGLLVKEGTSEEVVQAYILSSQEHILAHQHTPASSAFPAESSGDMRVTAVRILDSLGNPTDTVQTLEDVTVQIEFDVYELVQPLFGIAFNSIDNIPVLAFSSTLEDSPPLYTEPGRYVAEVLIPRMPLLPGIYSVALKIRGTDEHTIQVIQSTAEVRIICDNPTLLRGSAGFSVTERHWRFERTTTTPSGSTG